jgi:WD40 repeat protein
VKTLVFSPDGKTLVTADNADSAVAIWDTASGQRVATLEAGTGNVASAAFRANGTLIVATISNNAKYHRIEIWTTAQSLTASS